MCLIIYFMSLQMTTMLSNGDGEALKLVAKDWKNTAGGREPVLVEQSFLMDFYVKSMSPAELVEFLREVVDKVKTMKDVFPGCCKKWRSGAGRKQAAALVFWRNQMRTYVEGFLKKLNRSKKASEKNVADAEELLAQIKNCEFDKLLASKIGAADKANTGNLIQCPKGTNKAKEIKKFVSELDFLAARINAIEDDDDDSDNDASDAGAESDQESRDAMSAPLPAWSVDEYTTILTCDTTAKLQERLDPLLSEETRWDIVKMIRAAKAIPPGDAPPLLFIFSPPWGVGFDGFTGKEDDLLTPTDVGKLAQAMHKVSGKDSVACVHLPLALFHDWTTNFEAHGWTCLSQPFVCASPTPKPLVHANAEHPACNMHMFLVFRKSGNKIADSNLAKSLRELKAPLKVWASLWNAATVVPLTPVPKIERLCTVNAEDKKTYFREQQIAAKPLLHLIHCFGRAHATQPPAIVVDPFQGAGSTGTFSPKCVDARQAHHFTYISHFFRGGRHARGLRIHWLGLGLALQGTIILLTLILVSGSNNNTYRGGNNNTYRGGNNNTYRGGHNNTYRCGNNNTYYYY